MKKGNKDNKEPELSEVIDGTLNLFGLKIDLGKLLSSPDDVTHRLEELRERLKKAGGKEVLSDEEWRSGGMTVSGHVRTRGVLGEREYHIGTATPPTKRKGRERRSEPTEAVEPAVDVFYEAGEVVLVAEVPGVDLSDLELKIDKNVISLATKPTARRNYRKQIDLACEVDKESMQVACRNGILEVHLRKVVVQG